MFRDHRSRSAHLVRTLTLCLLATTAACEQATAPSTGLDARTTLADYKALEQLFASDGFAAVQGLGGRTPMSMGAVISAARALPGLTSERSGRQYAADLFRATAAQAAGTSFTKTVISNVHLGRTLVYNRTQDQYVIDPTRTGAPTNGVRFIAYELDAGGKPLPDKEIGHADLRDEGATTGEAIALRLTVVLRGTTTLEYRTRVDISTNAGSIDVSGFAVENNARLDFTIGLDARTSGNRTLIDADFELGVKPRGFTVTGTVRGVEDGREGEGDITLTARHQENTLRVAVSGNDGTLDGSITWNGARFVTISGPAANPTLVGASGQPLTVEEALVVRSVMRLSDDVFDAIEELVEPVEDLLLLGWIL